MINTLNKLKPEIDLPINYNKKIKIYSFLIAILPIIEIYASGIPGLAIGDVFIIFFLGISLVNSYKSKRMFDVGNTGFIFLAMYIILFSLLSLILQVNSRQIYDVLIRTIRFSFYVFSLVILSYKYFEYNISSKWVIRISVLATIYIIIQYSVYLLVGKVLKGFLSFIPLYSLWYADINYDHFYSVIFFRPTSFFLEPAAFTQYTIVGLILILFMKKNFSVRDFIIALFITLGILISTSIQGIIFISLIWATWIVKHLNKCKSKKELFISISFIFIIPIIVGFIIRMDFVQNTLSRINMEGGSDAVSGRFDGFSSVSDVQGVFKLIGLGYGSVPSNVWMSSAAYILYGSGIIGLTLVIILFIKKFIKSSTLSSKLLIIVFFLMLWESSIFNSYMFLFYFSFICYEFRGTSRINI